MTAPFSPPPGFRWCPACNGDGVVHHMDGTPDLREHDSICTFPGCEDGDGIVPITAPETTS